MKGPELEALLVGALLDSKEPLKLLQASGLQPESFVDSQMRVCWDIAWGLARQGRRVDAVTLFSAGSATKQIRAEDLGLLQALQARNSLSQTAFVQVANDLRRHAHSRLLGQELVDLGKQLLAGGDAKRAHAQFTAIGENYNRLHAEGRRGSTAVAAAFEGFDRRKLEGKPSLVTTGLDLLDEKTGGLPPKLCVFVGKPGVGKSALLASMVEQQLAAGLSILFFSLEDGDEWFIRRHMAKRLNLKVRDVFNKEFPDGGAAAKAGQELATSLDRLWFITKAQARTPADVVRISTQYIAQHGVDCVWLDNATALKHVPLSKFEQMNQAAGRMYDAFAEFADTFRVPMVVLAHTTRDYEKRTGGKGPPAISDIAETADAERAVRFGLGLWSKKGQFRLTVIKHTEGVPDQTLEFGMHADAAVVDHSSGTVVNLHAEAREERKESAERGDERAVATALRRKKLREQFAEQMKPAAPEAVEPPPQLTLLDISPEATP